jgi:hypothetical protein
VSYRKEFEDLKKRYERLKTDLAALNAKKELLKEEKGKLEAEILVMTKLPNIEALSTFKEKLEKEIENKMAILSQKISEVEADVEQLKSQEME